MTTRHRHRLALGSTLLLLVAVASGTAAAQADQSARAETAAPPAAVSAAGQGYLYDPHGRRDPFVSLLGRGNETSKPTGPRGVGIQGLTVAEMSVRGILQHARGLVAIVQGPDQKTHMLRANDQLADGTVKSIEPDGVVIVQEVHDPLSLVKQKEIRKGLQGSDEGK
jgi:Tfp pilus assembly protein PilP